MKWMTEISARCFGFYRGTNDPKPLDGGRKACVDGVLYSMGGDVDFRPFGPSFDCSRASTRVEKLFCSDKELMQVDSILGLTYDWVLSRKSDDERSKLIASQREWILSRNSVCDQKFTNSMSFRDTREAALCLFLYNEDRIYFLIEEGFH